MRFGDTLDRALFAPFLPGQQADDDGMGLPAFWNAIGRTGTNSGGASDMCQRHICIASSRNPLQKRHPLFPQPRVRGKLDVPLSRSVWPCAIALVVGGDTTVAGWGEEVRSSKSSGERPSPELFVAQIALRWPIGLCRGSVNHARLREAEKSPQIPFLNWYYRLRLGGDWKRLTIMRKRGRR